MLIYDSNDSLSAWIIPSHIGTAAGLGHPSPSGEGQGVRSQFAQTTPHRVANHAPTLSANGKGFGTGWNSGGRGMSENLQSPCTPLYRRGAGGEAAVAVHPSPSGE